MKKLIFKSILALLCISIVLIAIPVFACEEENSQSGAVFKDVPETHWAYKQIKWMVENKILAGMGEGYFKPDSAVTRAQYSTMMVASLKIQKIKPSNPTFMDMPKSHWAYTNVESARQYLTGFRTSSGDFFYPDKTSVREDIAVSLVKALNYGNEVLDYRR